MSKGKFVKFAAVLAGVALLMAAPVAMAATKISITGSTTVLPIGQKAAELFMKKHAGVTISVAGTGSGDGIKALIDGQTDIAMASREMKKKEEKLAAGKGVKPVRHVVGLDCIVPVVHPSNKVANLTKAQLKAIFLGEVKNWKEVGGADGPIVVISRDSSSGTFGVWKKRVMDKKRVRPDAQLQASNGAVAQAVAGNKYAIGYVGIGYLNKNLKGLTVNGVKASAKTALDKSYPIARSLNMYTNGEPKGMVKAYIEWIKSDEGQAMVEKEGFVPLKK